MTLWILTWTVIGLLLAAVALLWLGGRVLQADVDDLHADVRTLREALRRFEAQPLTAATPGRAAIRAHITRRLQRAIASRQRHA